MKRFLPHFFVLNTVCILTGAVGKIMHLSYIDWLLTAGIIFLAVYTITALNEILPSKKIHSSEKLMWTTGFLFFNTITGLLYLLTARKRITG